MHTIGLYVHIPFCRSKCRYCDFYSVGGAAPRSRGYIDALALEMERYRKTAISTIFFGGGTPSILPEEQFKRLWDHIIDIFDTSIVTEVTIEANPDSLTEDKLSLYRSCGVNRISIGAQSFDDEELKRLGRAHTASQFDASFNAARLAGFTSASIDLIYGLPGQSLAQWQKTLRAALDYAPEHLSLYPLTIEPDTPFASEGIKTDEELQALLYEWSMEFLAARGYEHYEISNWALPGFRCRHNMAYWTNKEYIGIGAAAASYINGVRSKNLADIDTYIARVNAGQNIVEESELIDGQKSAAEKIILPLRTIDGVPQASARQRNAPAVRRMIEERLLEEASGAIRLTRRGKLLANAVFTEFI